MTGRPPGLLFGGCDTAYASSTEYLGSDLYGSLAIDRGSFACGVKPTPRPLSTWDPISCIALLASCRRHQARGIRGGSSRGERAMPNLAWSLRLIGATSLVRIRSDALRVRRPTGMGLTSTA